MKNTDFRTLTKCLANLNFDGLCKNFLYHFEEFDLNNLNPCISLFIHFTIDPLAVSNWNTFFDDQFIYKWNTKLNIDIHTCKMIFYRRQLWHWFVYYFCICDQNISV
jgi:hypothetical protein